MSAETLKIRAHHLTGFNPLIQDYFHGDAEEFIQKMAKETIFELKYFREHSLNNYYRIGHSYKVDILGESDENEEIYTEALVQQMRKIFNLPKETLVVLSYEKDEVCNACFFGKHCDLPALISDADTVSLEGVAMWHEMKGFAYWRGEDRSLVTTMGILRKFLKIDKSK